MSVNGGTFTDKNKTLPGAYINLVSKKRGFQRGERGTVAVPMVIPWLNDGAVVTLTRDEFLNDSVELLGAEHDSNDLKILAQIFKNASKVVVAKVNKGGVKANKLVGGLQCTAKFPGVSGNLISVAVLANVESPQNVDIVTYFGGREMFRDSVAKTQSGTLSKENKLISYSTSGAITPAVRTVLTGGTNGNATGEEYANALKEIEKRAFNVVLYGGTDTQIKNVLKAFVERLRNEDGNKVVGVVSSMESPDSVGIINVSVPDGGADEKGEVTEEQIAAYIAGASAAADVNQSNTNHVCAGLVSIKNPLTKRQMEQAIKAGKMVIYKDDGKVRILADINSLTTFVDGGATKDWTSNRVIRTLDGIASDVATIFARNYTGKVTNSDTGRNLFKADLLKLGDEYQRIDAIEGFDTADVVVNPGTEKRDIEVEMQVKPLDSMEKLYMVVSVI